MNTKFYKAVAAAYTLSLTACASGYAYRSEVSELRARVKYLEAQELKHDDRVAAAEAENLKTREKLISEMESFTKLQVEVFMIENGDIPIGQKPQERTAAQATVQVQHANSFEEFMEQQPKTALGSAVSTVTGTAKAIVDKAADVVGGAK